MKLTRDEILLVVFIVAALCLGAGARNYRQTHPDTPKSTPITARSTRRSH